MKIHWYTLTYNESDIVPFVIQYYKHIISQGIDLKVFIFDNYSTDNTVELLKQYDFIEIRYFNTNGQFNDDINRYIKNECWKMSKGNADLVCVSDFDEVIYSNNLKEKLESVLKFGFNVLGTPWYALCGDELPIYDENKLLHQIINRGYKQRMNHRQGYEHLGKFMIFNPNLVDTMNYSVGCHISYPQPLFNLYVANDIYAIHFDKGFGWKYRYNKRNKLSQRIPQELYNKGYAYEYKWDAEKCKKEYQENVNNSIKLDFIR